MSSLHVHCPDDHDPTSIEARLGTMATTQASPFLRQRVLAAVDAVLAEPTVDMATDEVQWSLLAVAAAAALLVASWGGSIGLGRLVADAAPPQLVSLTDRMAAAGIRLEPFAQVLKESVEPL
jgi:hypothetical protein